MNAMYAQASQEKDQNKAIYKYNLARAKAADEKFFETGFEDEEIEAALIYYQSKKDPDVEKAIQAFMG